MEFVKMYPLQMTDIWIQYWLGFKKNSYSTLAPNTKWMWMGGISLSAFFEHLCIGRRSREETARLPPCETMVLTWGCHFLKEIQGGYEEQGWKEERKEVGGTDSRRLWIKSLRNGDRETPMQRLIEFSVQSMPSANIYSKRKIDFRVPKWPSAHISVPSAHIYIC